MLITPARRFGHLSRVFPRKTTTVSIFVTSLQPRRGFKFALGRNVIHWFSLPQLIKWRHILTINSVRRSQIRASILAWTWTHCVFRTDWGEWTASFWSNSVYGGLSGNTFEHACWFWSYMRTIRRVLWLGILRWKLESLGTLAPLLETMPLALDNLSILTVVYDNQGNGHPIVRELCCCLSHFFIFTNEAVSVLRIWRWTLLVPLYSLQGF